MNEKTVFVTVGTTKFDLLVSAVTQVEVLKALRNKGYKSIVIQMGNGSITPNEDNANEANIKLSYYRFKNSLKGDILNADLVISHAGAGTCLEVLGEYKPLLVVVNEELMHNHQTELADQLSFEGYLFACSCTTLLDAINKADITKLKRMLPGDPKPFVNFLNDFMGFEIRK